MHGNVIAEVDDMSAIMKGLKNKKVLVPLIIGIVAVTSLVIVFNIPGGMQNPLAPLIPESRTAEVKGDNFKSYMFVYGWASSVDSENIQAPGITIMAWKILATEDILKAQFGVDSLYLKNGTAKVLTCHDITGYHNNVKYENGFAVLYKSVTKNSWFFLSTVPPPLAMYENIILSTILSTNTK